MNIPSVSGDEEAVGFFLRGREDVVGCAGEAELRAGGAGEPVELGLDDLLNPAGVGADLLQQRMDDALFLREQRREEMKRHQLGVVPLLGQFLGPLDGFLCFNCEFIKSHETSMTGREARSAPNEPMGKSNANTGPVAAGAASLRGAVSP